MEEIKVKPCPFCGGMPIVMQSEIGYFVKCSSCYVQTVWYEHWKKAIRVWSRRVDK